MVGGEEDVSGEEVGSTVDAFRFNVAGVAVDNLEERVPWEPPFEFIDDDILFASVPPAKVGGIRNRETLPPAKVGGPSPQL